MISPISFINTKYNISNINSDFSNYQNNPVAPKPTLQKDSVSFGCRFFLTKVKQNPCAYCGVEMLTKEDIEKIARQFVSEKDGNAVKILKKYYDKIDKRTQGVLDILIPEIERQPEKSVTRIIRELANKFERVTNEKYQFAVHAAFKQTCIQYSSKMGQDLLKLIEESKMHFITPIENKGQKTIKISHLYKGINRLMRTEQSLVNKNQLERFGIAIDREFSFIKHDPTTFFPKYGNTPMETFFLNLFHSITVSIEHLTPQCKPGGIDDPSNFLIICKHCNNVERGSQDFKEFKRSHPFVPRNIEKQLAFYNRLMTPDKRNLKDPFDKNKKEIGDYLEKIIPEIEAKLERPIQVKMPNYQRYLEWKNPPQDTLVIGASTIKTP